MIQIEKLSFSYSRKGNPALDGITAAVGPGIHLLIGENGAGKTTLLHLMAGVALPSSGSIRIDASRYVRDGMDGPALIYYCTPIVFAKGADSRIINRLIPVSAGERLTFYYLYLLVVIPAILFIPPYIGSLIYRASYSLQTPGALELYRLKFTNMGILSLINLGGGILVCTLCFLCVERARFNRLLWGIVAVIGGNFFLGVLGAVIAGTNAFQQGLKDGLEGNSPINANSKELLESTFATLSKANPVTIAGFAIIAIMVVVVALLTYQTLKRRNL